MDIGHTKGPWVAEAADIFGDHNIVLADRSEDCRAVAAVVSNMRDPLEVEANARLIAAAPDFAEVAPDAADILERYAEFIRTVGSCDLERHPYLPEVERIAETLRAAISKATSRQPEGER